MFKHLLELWSRAFRFIWLCLESALLWLMLLSVIVTRFNVLILHFKIWVRRDIVNAGLTRIITIDLLTRLEQRSIAVGVDQ